jgi:uncharacterized protein YhaN
VVVESEVKLLQDRLASSTREGEEQRAQLQELRERVQQLLTAEDELHLAALELSELRQQNHTLQAEVQPLKDSLHEAMERLRSLAQSETENMDKRLVSTLLLTYLTGEYSKQREILELMSRILDWSDEQQRSAGLTLAGSSWLPSFLRPKSTLPIGAKPVAEPKVPPPKRMSCAVNGSSV